MSESHKPVAEAMRRTERPCPSCGRPVTGTRCPACGADTAARRTRQRPGRRAALVATALLAVVAAIVFVFAPAMREDADRERRAAAAAQQRLEARERARLIREGKPVEAAGPERTDGEAPLAYRARLVTAGETLITADARARLERGELDAPVRGTHCTPYPKTDTRAAQERDLSLPRNRYQCIAFSRRFALTELQGKQRTGVIGQPYWLIIEYGSGAMTFCKVTPRAGEGGRSLVVVPVDPACRNPLA